MYKFLNGNFFQTIIILLVGLFIFVVYNLQKKNEKKKISALIIGEIRDLESRIDSLRSIPSQSYNPIIFYNFKSIGKNNSWEMYKHHYVNNLNVDEFDILNKFYDYAMAIEEHRKELKSTAAIIFEGKAKGLQEQVCIAATRNVKTPQDFQNDINVIYNLISQMTPDYNGQLQTELLVTLLNECPVVSITTAGQVIHKLARL